MKVHSSSILAIAGCCFFHWGTAAFTVMMPSKALKSTSSSSSSVVALKSAAGSIDLMDMFPMDPPMQTIQGGEALRTFPLPPEAERVQMVFKTNGRPLKARVELWLGPQRRTHFVNIDSEDGVLTPFRATLKFKKGGQVLRIGTMSSQEFPMQCGLIVPSPERSAQLGAYTQRLWDTSEKVKVQGGSIEGNGKGGAVRIFPVASNVESVSVILWSKDVGAKSLKAKIEVLQGPNNIRQSYDLQCGGGSQPYHAVFQTPGQGVSIRIVNKKFIEDGLFEAAVIPYKVGPPVADWNSGVPQKQWWE